MIYSGKLLSKLSTRTVKPLFPKIIMASWLLTLEWTSFNLCLLVFPSFQVEVKLVNIIPYLIVSILYTSVMSLRARLLQNKTKLKSPHEQIFVPWGKPSSIPWVPSVRAYTNKTIEFHIRCERKGSRPHLGAGQSVHICDRIHKPMVKVHTLDKAPLRSESSPQKRSGIWHVFSRDLTVLPAHPHVHPRSEWVIPAFCLPSNGWCSFTDPGRMKGWGDLGAK